MNVSQRFFRVKAFFWALFLFLCVFGFRASAVEAATLYFSPASGNYNVGQDFSVSVFVSSADQAMNAAQGVINFPSDRLQVTSLSKAGSVMSLWVQEPSFTAGSINFEGIVLNPGFTGNAGKIITINFKVKAAGSGTLSFTSGSVLANDGQGTNILSGLSSANFSLISTVASPEAPAQPTTPASRAPAAPTVSSPTHPEQEKWYTNNNPKFEWTNPRGTTGVNVLVDHDQNSDPGAKSDGVMNSYTFNDVDDGVWYFHIKLQNSEGWGKTSHFKFQIDSEKPESLVVEQVEDKSAQASSVQFRIEAKDAVSGISYYDIKIDNSASEVWKDDGSHVYTTPILDKGAHTIVVKVFDKAGNVIADTEEFESKGILPPRITKYPLTLDIGDPLAVRGNTYPKSQVTLAIAKDGMETRKQTVISEEDGTFTIIYTESLEKGEYTISATVTDTDGHASEPSEGLKVRVQSPAFLDIGGQASNILIIAIPSFFFLVVLFLLLYHIWRKLRDTKKRLRKEIHDVEASIHDAFQMLHSDMKKHLKLLESTKTKRELTREEEKILSQMKRDIEIAEKIVNKEIDDMKEEIE